MNSEKTSINIRHIITEIRIAVRLGIETLKLLANDKSQPVCSNYNDLKDGVFWDNSAYAVLTADKLGFKEDNVGIYYGRKPVGYDYHGPVTVQVLDGLLYTYLCDVVQG